jgi:hypothetical protein
MRQKQFLSIWHILRKPCAYLAPTLTPSTNGPKQDSRWPTLPRSSIGFVKNDFRAYVTFKQTMHLSCIKISTISKQTEMSFQLSLVTWEYHPVHPKWFLSPWYVWCKPCTYLVLTLTSWMNGLEQDSTWPPSPRSTNECVQNDFWACGTFSVNYAPTLHWEQRLQTDQNEIPYESHHLGVPSGASKTILSLWYVWRKPCTYLASRLALSPKGPKRALSWASSPRSTIVFIQNEFRSLRPKWFPSLLYIRSKPCTYPASRLALSQNGLKRASSWGS